MGDAHPTSMTESNSPQPPTEPGRWAARLSILAAYVCFTLTCTFQQLTAKQKPADVWLLNQIVSWSSLLFVVAGIVLGVYGLIVGLRRHSQTAGIAVIGLVLNLGIVFVMLWVMWILRQAAVK